ncbi:hypothetical protein ABI59_15830 [Acidobacteria bacterium Mor1]|nr:hypothetical protein ABI59_15830 [Acidobacteria bacterium Mor1]
MAKPCTKPRRSTPNSSSSGFSLVELLVAMVILLLIMAAGLTISMSSRTTLRSDQNRTTLNQNLRSGMDLVGIDIRQAGERLPADVPALEIRDGASGAADTLVVRRNLADDVLPVCVDIASGSSTAEVTIALTTGTIPAGCDPVADTNTDGWADNLGNWRAERIAAGGTMTAYIYNPTTRLGEFFEFDGEDAAAYHLDRSSSGTWTNDYLASDSARVYVMEEREFSLSGGILEMDINGSGSPFSLVDDVVDFQLRAIFQDGTIQTALAAADDWSNLEAIEVNLSGRSTFMDRTMDRALSSRYFPRNVLSQ